MIRVLMLSTFIASVVTLSAGSQFGVEDTKNGVLFYFDDMNLTMAVEVGSASTFRLGISFSPEQGGGISLMSPSLDTSRSMAAFTKTSNGDYSGIKTSFGSLLVDSKGRMRMLDASGKQIVMTDEAPTLTSEGNGSILTRVLNTSGTGPGAGKQPCLSNGGFAPPYLWDPLAGVFAFAVSPWSYDPDNIHCYPASFTQAVENDKSSKGTCTDVKQGFDVSGYKRSPSTPNGVKVNESGVVASCCAVCDKVTDCTAWVATSDGKPDGSGMNCWLFSCVDHLHSSSDRVFGGATSATACNGPSPPSPPSTGAGWWGKGVSMDYYLAPAPLGYHYIKQLYDLTGAPAVPPRHGMAFMATYWGYTSMNEVEGYMHQFRNGSYPIDSFIMDYDWFGPQPCGNQSNGALDCGDFGYKGSFWTNQTFSKMDGTKVYAATPKDVLAHYHTDLNMRFAGIRKPRSYSNINMSKDNGWLLDPKSSVGAGGNNWNYSVAAMREWYTKGHLHFLDDGIDYWWNDEGETEWFTYLYWNMAQQAQWDAVRPNERHFTINRAFQPGMQRFPAITWSGDGQDCSHSMIIRFTMYGQLYTACDMTSPDATVLVRQYQNAVFMPIMRVHQMHGTPRFPFLWGGDEHHIAFRQALDMRYRFLPFMYSLAHRAHRYAYPIGHPASFEFPLMTTGDETYMVGGVLLPADVSTSHNTQGENSTTVNLPPLESWYLWNTTTTVAGGQTIQHTVALAEMVVYVRQGAILPLQATKIQYSDNVGGLLQVQVYGGNGGMFEMVEDDGATLDYKNNSMATKTTKWVWDDKAKTLSYAVTGDFSGPNLFTSVQAVLFETGNSGPTFAQTEPLKSTGGSIVFH